MNQKLLIEKCRLKGIETSVPLLYRYGIKEGWLIKTENTGREKYIFNEKLFDSWLDKNSKIPSDLVSLKDAEDKYNIPYQSLKRWLKVLSKETIKMGIGVENLYYAKREDIEFAVSKYHKRSKK